MGSRSYHSVRLPFLLQSHSVIPLILNLVRADLSGAKVKVIWLPLIRILDITVFRKIRETRKMAVSALVIAEVGKKQMSVEHQVVNYST